MAGDGAFDDALKGALQRSAEAHGFARFGVAQATELVEEGAHLDRWLDAGRHASMRWMADTAAVRKDPRHDGMLSGAASIVVLVAPYVRDGGRVMSPGLVAKYALGRDYHNVLRKRAKAMVRALEDAGYRARLAVDSKPVFERAWAERAGVGFIGKNSCLIVPGVGSHVFLACLVTDAPLRPDEPMLRRCGECRLCLDHCPTDAFVGPRELDANACISYLTIEHRGPVPESRRAQIGEWLFGCDDCQDVCPYNQTAAPVPGDHSAFRAREAWGGIEAESFLGMDESAFAEWAAGSPVKRAHREGMARNAAIVLGNRGDKLHLPVLKRAAAEDASDVVRDAARWAVAQLNRRLDS